MMRSVRTWIIGCYGGGVLLWIAFFFLVHPLPGESQTVTALAPVAPRFAAATFTAHDWYKELAYESVIGQALRERTMPYAVPAMDRVFRIGGQFLGAPIWTMSPQALLLAVLPPMTFTVVNVLLMYTVGFFGLVALQRRYTLAPLPFTFLFLLLNCNGYFIGKMAAYGPAQLGYFLLPFFLLLMAEASERCDRAEPNQELRRGILLGVVLALMLLQGSLHFFVQAFTFVLIWGIANWRRWRAPLIAAVSACALGAIRLAPAAVAFGAAPNDVAALVHGYSLRQPWLFLVALGRTTTHLSEPYPFAWWEFSVYVGWIGVAALLTLGIAVHLRKTAWVRFTGWRALAVPTIALFVLSFWKFKNYLIPNAIPLLSAEALTSRYMIFPLLVVALAATVNLNAWWERARHRRFVRGTVTVLGVAFSIMLVRHAFFWRMHRVQHEFDAIVAVGRFGTSPPEALTLAIENSAAVPPAIIAVWVGAAITLLAVVTAIVWWRRSFRNAVV